MPKNNQDLFKTAIADAKIMRQAALESAKLSLQESLSPQISNMLSTKLQEMEDEELDENVDNELEEDFNMDSLLEDDEIEEGDRKPPKVSNLDAHGNTIKEEDEADEADEAEADEVEDVEAEDVENEEVEEDVDVKDLSLEDLKTLIQDIVSQEVQNTGDMDNELEDGGIEDVMDDEGGIEGETEDDEEINIDELLAELDNDLNESDEEEIEEGKDQYKEELKEAIKTINALRVELKEVNLLNAKLIYVNKIFKKHNLTEAQKLKLIGTFDKAETIKEAKIIFETLSIPTSKQTTINKTKTRLKENLSLASKTIKGTRKLNENLIVQDDFIARFQKLANIKK